jgi:protein phosphatase
MDGGEGKVVHVGDSRVYLFRNKELVQLTRDHTLTAELVERQHISPEGAKRHPLRHMLSRSLGTADQVEPDICDVRLWLGDRLILVTDGLTKSLQTDDLSRVLCESIQRDAEGTCRAIMDAALERGPTDDLTTVVVQFLEDTK